MAYYLGIDVGTSGTKVLVMNPRATILATATAEHDISAPKPTWSEQKPDDWWRATVKAVRAAVANAKINGKQVAGIGLSGQMHGLVITDAGGKVLRPSIIWNDQRSGPQAAEIERKVGGKKKLISLVGNVKTPTIVICGEEDWRCPIVESEQYYLALKMLGIETVLVRFPGASHGIANRPSQHLSKMLHIISWFDKHKTVE